MFYTSIKNMDKNIIKEIFIIILLLAVIIFTLSILFYDCLNIDVEKIENIKDISTQNIDKVMENAQIEIDNNSSENKTYTRKVTQEEIDQYFSENSYDKGKKNPFEEVSNTKSNSNNENNEGSFFENKTSK